jgi:hypothetical protein
MTIEEFWGLFLIFLLLLIFNIGGLAGAGVVVFLC